jgi:hypothetical protein
LQILSTANITVVAEPVLAVLRGIGKGIEIHRTVIEGLSHTGVDGQLLYGILVKKLQDLGKFFGTDYPYSGFDGDGDRTTGKNLIQKPLRHSQIPEHPGAFPLGENRTGGTAHIQVHFTVAPFDTAVNRPEEVLRGLRENLGNGLIGLSVCMGQLPFLLGTQAMILGRGEEGHIIPVHTAEILTVHPAVAQTCDPFQRSEVVIHVNIPPNFTVNSIHGNRRKNK